ncbi:MAG: tetratricopeptide repeat protein [Bacteroidota bacterium]
MEVTFQLFAANLDVNQRKALQYAEMSYEEAKKLNDTLRIIRAGNARGFVFSDLGKFKEAITDFEYILPLTLTASPGDAEEVKSYRQQRKFILNNLGRTYFRAAEVGKALERYLESLKLREEDKDTVAIALALNNIGALYHQIGDRENALSYYAQSYQLLLKTNQISARAHRLVNIADVSTEMGRYDVALAYLKDVFALCASGCDKRDEAFAHHIKGEALMKTGKLQEAEKEFLTALKTWQEVEATDEVEELSSLAELKMLQGQYERALEYLETSQDMAEEINFPVQELRNYRLYAEIFTRLGDMRLVAEYRQKYIELNEKIYNADMMRTILRIQSKYQEAENLATIERQGNELVVSKELISAQRNQVIFFTVACVLVVGIDFILYRFNLSTTRSNIALKTAKGTIEQQNNELTEINRTLDQRIMAKTQELIATNISLQKSNEELDNFIYKTSHDIRGPLASLKGIASLALIESKDEEVSKYIRMLDDTAEGLIKILTRLVSISQITHAKLAPVSVDFQSLINDVLLIQTKRGIPAKFNIRTEIGADTAMITDRTLLSIVMENLIDNAIKFQNTSDRAESFVLTRVVRQPEGITISVIDNGIGIDKVSADKIFQMFVRASERSETGGLGLYLSRIAVEKLGGRISLNITPEKWTEFRVVLPADLNTILEERRQAELQREMEKMMMANKQQS